VSASLWDGKVTGEIKIDVRRDVPAADMDLRVANLKLGKFARRKSVAELGASGAAGGAIALGMLLTPIAAMLAFVDPGLAKDTDCGALLAEAETGGK
jgi:hypothetical protein